MLTTVSGSPLEIIKKQTTAAEDYLVRDFMDMVQRIYQYELFKPMLDLVATLAMQGRLSFNLAPKKVFDLDEGNCRTVETGTRAGTTIKTFVITIKKMKTDVVIHEIGHMVENESGVSLDMNFNRAIAADLRGNYTKNISLQTAIKNIMIMEVANYPDSHKSSELFTRYFQLLALAKEVAGFAAEYAYTILDVYKAFPNTIDWIWSNLYTPMFSRIDSRIAMASFNFTVPINEIRHKWAKEKIGSVHKDPEKPKWSRAIKSIKD
ncbi:MAG: hypothetical protein ACHP6I_00985 [Rickettsiales bacterium]